MEIVSAMGPFCLVVRGRSTPGDRPLLASVTRTGETDQYCPSRVSDANLTGSTRENMGRDRQSPAPGRSSEVGERRQGERLERDEVSPLVPRIVVIHVVVVLLTECAAQMDE